MTTLINDIKTIKNRMVCRKVDNEMVLVPLVNEVAEMKVIYTLNEVATFVWEKLDEVETFDNLTEAVVDNFEIDKETAMNDINIFFEELQEKTFKI